MASLLIACGQTNPPPTVPPAAPSPEDDTTTASPAANPNLIAGLLAADALAYLREGGLSCGDATPLEGDSLTWRCQRDEGDAHGLVVLYGRATTQIWLINAEYRQTQPATNDAAKFLGFVASVSYEGADPSRATAWIQQTLPAVSEGQATERIGAATLHLKGPATARVLQMVSATGTP
jgi:hypothetical protein